jgi:hypothetical protein
MIALSPKGAGVALFSTTRATYAGANMQLSEELSTITRLLRPSVNICEWVIFSGYAKNATGNIENKSKFSLFGNPALKLALC